MKSLGLICTVLSATPLVTSIYIENFSFLSTCKVFCEEEPEKTRVPSPPSWLLPAQKPQRIKELPLLPSTSDHLSLFDSSYYVDSLKFTIHFDDSYTLLRLYGNTRLNCDDGYTFFSIQDDFDDCCKYWAPQVWFQLQLHTFEALWALRSWFW